MRLLACLVISVLLAGCTSAGPLSQEEAEALMASAVENFRSDVLAMESGDLRRIDMEIMFAFGDEGGSMDMRIDFGQDDVQHIWVTSDFDGEHIEVEMYCDGERTVVVQGDETIDGEVACIDPAAYSQGQMDLATYMEQDGFIITPSDDGGAQATFDLQGASGIIEADAQGRITHVTVTGFGIDVDMRVDYGPRPAIAMPE